MFITVLGTDTIKRLKHMAKDKIYYHTRGPRASITRQALQGRTNDGGLRIGEIERDGVIEHGKRKYQCNMFGYFYFNAGFYNKFDSIYNT